MGVGKRLRFEVLKRDDFRCRYCGKKGEVAELHVDHIKPKSKGGSDDASNLVAACIDCNAGKSNLPLDVKTAKRPAIDDTIDRELRNARHHAEDFADPERSGVAFSENEYLEIYFDGALPEGYM